MFEINEFFDYIDNKKEEKEHKEIKIKSEESLSDFLKEVENYIGEYAKDRAIKSGKEILELCKEYEDILNNEDIFYYYKAYGQFLVLDINNSMRNINKAIEINNKIYDYHLLKGKCYEQIGNDIEATVSYLKSYNLNNKCLRTLKKLGFTFISLAKPKDALIYFEKAFFLEKEDHQIYAGLAGCYYETGEVHRALELITKAIELDDRIPNYFYNRALINRALINIEDAIFDYKKTIELEPSYYSAYYHLADLYLQLDNVAKAREFLDELIIINPKYADAYMKLSYCMVLGQRMDEALEYMNKAIEIDDLNEDYYHKRAGIYKAMGTEHLAEDDYLKLIDMNNNNPYIYHILGEIYIDKEMYEKAVFYLEQGSEIEECASFYGNIAICYYNLGNITVAKEYFTKSIDLSSENTIEDYFFRAKCSYYLKEDDLGREDFEYVLEESYENTGALYYLAYISYYEYEYKETIKYINSYMELEDKEYGLLTILAESYAEIGEFKKAVETLKRVKKLEENQE